MRQEVFVQFGNDREFALLVAADNTMSNADARRWLDQQFIANECEPLRASGKVLTADKVLALAVAVGPHRFAEDAAFAHDYARAALAALGKPLVRVDVDAGAVTF
jgi:hypothetical protein